MADHIEFTPGALQGEMATKLREIVMLSAPPHPDAHLAGMVVVSLWHKPSEDTDDEGQMIESNIFVQPQERRREVLHVTTHHLIEALESDV